MPNYQIMKQKDNIKLTVVCIFWGMWYVILIYTESKVGMNVSFITKPQITIITPTQIFTLLKCTFKCKYSPHAQNNFNWNRREGTKTSPTKSQNLYYMNKYFSFLFIFPKKICWYRKCKIWKGNLIRAPIF